MADQKDKQIKLQPKHRVLTNSEKIVPELKLSGVWLEKSGFKAGEMVNVTVREGLLIIQTIES